MDKHHYVIMECKLCGKHQLYPINAISQPAMDFITNGLVHVCSEMYNGMGETYGLFETIGYVSCERELDQISLNTIIKGDSR